MSNPGPIKVMLVDDHDMVRRGLAVFLQAFDDFELVGEAASGEEAVRLCPECKPDVVLIDLIMPDMDGITAIHLLRQQQPQIQVIALTSYKDEGLIQATLQAGAIGFLYKDVSITQLGQAIRAAHVGEPFLAAQATQALISKVTRPAAPKYDLTGRELQVLALVVNGYNNPQIAKRLNVSRSTVKTHVSNILSKLGATNRFEAANLARQHNLVT